MTTKFTKEQLALLEAHQRLGHSGTMSRREMVGAGVMAGTAGIAIPSVLEIIGDMLGFGRAYGVEASTCVGGLSGTAPTHINLHLESGWNAGGAFLIAGKQELGQPIQYLEPASYASLGYASAAAPQARTPNTDFGHPAHSAATFTTKLSSFLPAAVKAKSRAFMITGVSADDSPNALSSEFFSLGAIGQRGGLVQIVENQAVGQYLPAGDFRDPTQTRAIVSNSAALVQLVGAGQLGELFGGREGAIKIAKAIDSMGSTRVNAFHAMGFNDQLRRLVQCNYALSPELLKNFTPENLDPASDSSFVNAKLADNSTPFTASTAAPGAASLAGANEGTEATALAIITKLCADGNARFGRAQLSGFDYHGRGRANNDDRDTFAAKMVASVINAFAIKAKPVFITISTSGAVSCSGTADANGKIPSTADSGARSNVMGIAFHPTAAPVMKFSQIGKYNETGAVETSSSGGVQANNITNLAKVVAANYAAFAGKYPAYAEFLRQVGASNPIAGQENKYIMFDMPG